MPGGVSTGAGTCQKFVPIVSQSITEENESPAVITLAGELMIEAAPGIV